MSSLETLRESLPEYARDLKINLQSLLSETSLTLPQRLGVALASAVASRQRVLIRALQEETLNQAGHETQEDALAAAAMMGMTNIYYRFKHLIGKEDYSELPARLRMQRVAKPASSKADFELFCLAVSAINGCGSCIQAHEKGLLEAGFSQGQINDAVRIASTIHGLAVVLDEMPEME